VPTISEAGVPGYQADNWWGITAPAGTPKPIVDRLYKEVSLIMNSEDTKKIFDSQGAEVDLMGSTEFGKFFEAEIAKWKKVIEAANVKVE
jgi:tripartite-type tricarboxylate transporter receptor subunit TctC